MKLIVYISFIALLPSFCFADAGFNIGRPKAPCSAVFTGIDKLNDFEFIKTGFDEENMRKDKDYNSSDMLANNQSVNIYYREGGRRRYFHGPVKILIRNKLSKIVIDSFFLDAEGYNLVVNFTGVGNNKVKYTIDRSRADYPYELFSGDDNGNVSIAKRNRYILISLSVIGFLTLAFMFFKRRKTESSQKPENI